MSTIEVKAGHGIIIAEAFDNKDYPAIDINYRLKDTDISIPIVKVEDCPEMQSGGVDKTNDSVVVYVYGDPEQEDFTHRIDIPISSIKKSYEEMEVYDNSNVLDEQAKSDLMDYYDNLDPAYRHIFWDVLCNVGCETEFKEHLEAMTNED